MSTIPEGSDKTEQARALYADLVAHGVPVILTTPHTTHHRKCKPKCDTELDHGTGWERITTPDPTRLRNYRPGEHTVAAVTGHGIDMIDVDTKNGADIATVASAAREAGVVIVGMDGTPSGGAHLFVASTGIASAANSATGVDFRGGCADGSGRGLAYLPGSSRPKYPGKDYIVGDPIDWDLLAGLDAGEQQEALCRFLSGVGITPRLAGPDTHTTSSSSSTATTTEEAEPLPAEGLPEALSDLIADLDPDTIKDRSARFHHLVGECYRAGLTKGQAVTALTPWCETVGKYEGRVKTEVARSWDKIEQEDTAAWVGDQHDHRDDDGHDLHGLKLTPTDDGNGRALVGAHGSTLRFVSGLGWHEWDGTRWTPDREERVRELAKAVFRRYPTDTKAGFAHARYSLSAVGTSNALRQAQSDPRVRIAPELLDADPYLLNTPAGVVDLRTGDVRAHDPRLLQSKITVVSPDRDMAIPLFTRFLQETFRGDADLIEYVRILLGYALIGDVREHVLPIATGPGGNGKGVLFDTVTAIIGDVDTGGYGLHANEGLLSTTSSHPTELARLFGARLVIAAEQDGKRPFAESRVKRLTGGDPITGRRMRMDFFTFTPSHSIVVVGNELPPVETGGPSFWRRVRVVPFLNTPADPDSALKTKLWSEAPGILAWMVSGAVDYLRANRLPEPESVMQASRDYQQSEDPLNVWFGEHLTVDDNGSAVPCIVIYERYKQWCKDNGHEPQGQRTVTFRMQSEYGLGLTRTNVAGRRQNCLKPLVWTVDFVGDHR